MIGLGVGIDYALFILTRFREAYATPGPTFQDARESVVQAIDTAGRAVLFAGSTVVIALLGMMLLGVDFLYGVAISASIGVLLVMFASLTLLPALLTMAGARVAAGGRRAPRARTGARPSGRASASPARAPDASGAAARGRDVAALERLRAAPPVGDRARRSADDAADRRTRDRRCGSARATPPTTPPARPRTAPMSCSRRASAKASTARCWSSPRSPTRKHEAAENGVLLTLHGDGGAAVE